MNIAHASNLSIILLEVFEIKFKFKDFSFPDSIRLSNDLSCPAVSDQAGGHNFRLFAMYIRLPGVMDNVVLKQEPGSPIEFVWHCAQ